MTKKLSRLLVQRRAGPRSTSA